MTYFSVNVIMPLEKRFEATGHHLPRTALKQLALKWPKYLGVAIIGAMLCSHAAYLTHKYTKLETDLVTTFSFANSSTRLPFPGIRLCLPQIFRWHNLQQSDILFLLGKSTPSPFVKSIWMPNLTDFVVYLSVNAEILEPTSFLVDEKHDYYRVCWQSNKAKYFSGSPGTAQQIEMIIDMAEYADIVHPSSPYLRHAEIIPFDQDIQTTPDDYNAIHLSPGRYSLVSLSTVKIDSTIRPENSVSCSNYQTYNLCHELVNQNVLTKQCKRSVVRDTSVKRYTECMKTKGNVQLLCKTSCRQTKYKSFKSEAKLKFVKNLRNIPIPATASAKMHKNLQISIELNSKYNDDYRRPIVSALPQFIDSTFQILELLLKDTETNQQTRLPEVNFDFDLPSKINEYSDFKSDAISLIRLVRQFHRQGMHHSKKMYKQFMLVISAKGSTDAYFNSYLSRARNDIVGPVNPNWLRLSAYTGRTLASLMPMIERVLNLEVHTISKRGWLDSTLRLILGSKASSLFAAHERRFIKRVRKVYGCYSTGGNLTSFTSNWISQSQSYLLINGTDLYSEREHGYHNLSNWYRNQRKFTRTEGVPIFIDNIKRPKVFLPNFVLDYCIFVKSFGAYIEKSVVLDRQFSFTNSHAMHRVIPSFYSLFVLNNILQTDDRWGLRPESSRNMCDEESCACQIATDQSFLGPDYLPMNATWHQTLKVAKSRTLKNYFLKMIQAASRVKRSADECLNQIGMYKVDADRLLHYFYVMLTQPYEKSITLLKEFSQMYDVMRKAERLRTFRFLLKTYSLKSRFRYLHAKLTAVLLGDSFEEMATFLVKSGKIMLGEVQFLLHELDTAYKEYTTFLHKSAHLADEVFGLIRTKPSTEREYFMIDIFNDTANAVLRREILRLDQIATRCRESIEAKQHFINDRFVPLRYAIITWSEQVTFFITRSKRYVDSKDISKTFLGRNIAMLSLFYDTLNIRFETNHYKYPLSQYRSDWGSILAFYYGLEMFSLLQVLTFIVTVILTMWQRRQRTNMKLTTKANSTARGQSDQK